ncbi:unnamed protein product [Cochlearia groenlandica]
MEALSFVKFWLTNATGKPRREIRISESAVASTNPEIDLNEGDDSFFDLEISLLLKQNETFLEREAKQRLETTTTFSVSKSKIIPFVETNNTTKPQQQSPITLTKSGQNSTTTITFRKTASIAKPKQTNDTMFVEDSVYSVSSSPSSSSSSSSKRFFSLIKPLYTKTVKKQSITGTSPPVTSPASSPAAREKQRNSFPTGIRSVKIQLGKSRSASAAVGVMSPAKRVDEYLQVQQDGIQSAILHCKNSFHGSRESSMLSRSTSESSSQEKLSTSSSEDSYLFSRISVDSLSSIKEQREKISD